MTWEQHLLSLNLKKTASSGSKPFKQMFPLGRSLSASPRQASLEAGPAPLAHRGTGETK